ncbi:MT-A70 family methyltransferase [Methylocystis sp. SC2]|uniref:MT-A70 family methyltransferase n=1 Tax=Methylocystis sp. (strain SC2) TaxID=187303 RepID=UPI00027AF025|nr:MT-A70 family methyltransferase [Methylocystis sp. SC2]CCJ07077.1 MT-A70 family protein [Methylocystis sp. SC2]
MLLIPSHPLANIFPMIEGEDFAALTEDIRANGLREKIKLYDGMILDGRNRYRACLEADVDPVFELFDGDDPVAYVISLNLRRRQLDESQRAMVAARLANMRQGARTDLRPSANLPEVSQPLAAQLTNVSERSVRSARKVIESGDDNLAAAVDRGKVAVSIAAKIADMPAADREKVMAAAAPEHAVKKVARQKREEELADKQRALPNKKYGVIYADPEWRFETYSRETGMDRAADNHYPTSETQDICARGVVAIAADDCVLFLWATAPMLPDALRVIAAWGFAYKSHCIWAKDKIGTGYWFRNQHELLLIGTRGNVPAPAMGGQWPSLIEAPVGAHSAKPEKFAEMIEAYFPNLPKIELNRRGPPRDGWDAWGNEAGQSTGLEVGDA